MDPITVIQLGVIIAIIIVSMMILKWITDRYNLCGVTDPLCYITGVKTSITNIISDINPF